MFSKKTNAIKIVLVVLLTLVLVGGVFIALQLTGVFDKKCDHRFIDETVRSTTEYQKLALYNSVTDELQNVTIENSITDAVKIRYPGLNSYSDQDGFVHIDLKYNKQSIVLGYIDRNDGGTDFYLNGEIVDFDITVGGEDATIALYCDSPLDDGTTLVGIGLRATVGLGSASNGVGDVLRNCDIYYQFITESTHKVCAKCGQAQ